MLNLNKLILPHFNKFNRNNKINKICHSQYFKINWKKNIVYAYINKL